LIQQYVMKLVSDLRQVGGFLRILRFRPEILLEVALSTITLTKYLSYKLNLSYATILQCSRGKSHKTSLTIRSIRRKPPTCRKSLTSFITYCCIKYTSPSAGFELRTLVVTGTYFSCSCKSNHHTMTTTKGHLKCTVK
jgi:hypothetical protein